MRTVLMLVSLAALASAASISLDIGDTNVTQQTDLTQLEPRNLGMEDSHLVQPKQLAQTKSTDFCGCGYSVGNPAPGANRIVGGKEVDPPNAVPYQAFIQVRFSNKQEFICGATLLNKRYAVTAYHCLENTWQITSLPDVRVHLGLWHRQYNAEQTIKVDRVISSDQPYDGSDNDIALLHLSEDAIFSDKIVPACLPSDASKTYAGELAIVSGWGDTSYRGDDSLTLKAANLTIMEQNSPKCTAYRNYEDTLPMSQMCAFAAGTDSCQGDSGGPLVVKEDGRWTLVGVVSYGKGCANMDYAGVYARVTNFLDWINSEIADGWC